jgi:hypothetical protein
MYSTYVIKGGQIFLPKRADLDPEQLFRVRIRPGL